MSRTALKPSSMILQGHFWWAGGATCKALTYPEVTRMLHGQAHDHVKLVI